MSSTITSISQYQTLLTELQKCSREERKNLCRHLARTDLFFLLTVICGRDDIWRHPKVQWIIDRCREVEASPNGHLDLWAREHYKSTIITFALVMQDILSSHGENPDPKWQGKEVTVGIFSVTRPTAKAFLRQIKLEFERNDTLKWLFPDILYEKPEKEAPKWSEDDGIVVKRKGNPKESTVEAWGLVDSQPTSKHFLVLHYDDVVTEKSVTSPEMMRKTTEALQLSYNCGTDGGYRRFIGTRYHFADSYGVLLQAGTAEPRVYPCTDNGEADGEPVLQSREFLEDKRRASGPYIFACQMLLNPKADEVQGFDEAWLKHYKPERAELNGNIYIVVDPASEKKRSSDYTAGWVLEACADEKIRVREMLRDRLNLTERADWLFQTHRKYIRHGVLGVGYEKYGMQADIEHIQDRQERESYQFDITPLGGAMPKNDRIKRLIPWFEQGRILLPESFIRSDYQGRRDDLVQVFKDEEYVPFPVMFHDDMLDSLSRILDEDMRLTFPAPDGAEIRWDEALPGTFAFG